MARDAAEGYTTREVAEALGLATSEIQAWTRGGVLAPSRDDSGAYHYSFQDVALLREARELLDGTVPARKVRAALRTLRAQLPAGQPLSAVRLSLAGERILARDAERVWEPESGQLFMDFVAEGPAREDRGEDGAELEAAGTDDHHDTAAAADISAPAAADISAPAVDARTPDDWYDEGLDLESTSLPDAEAAYRRALELDPGHVDAHLNLGRILHERGQLPDAEAHYRAAATADPAGAPARYNLGVVLEDGGRTVEAMAAYREALGLDDRLGAAHFNLARLCEAQGDEAEALGHLAAYKRLQGELRTRDARR